MIVVRNFYVIGVLLEGVMNGMKFSFIDRFFWNKVSGFKYLLLRECFK